VCALKLTDAARAFYSATPELRNPTITWQYFKARFSQRFRDIRSVQYHFGQLYMARQRKGETAQGFLDRYRLLSRTVPCVTDPVLQQAYKEQAERMLLSAFSNGILGTPGREVRFASPATVEEALRIAVTVSQAEIQEARDNAFYLNTEVADITPPGRVREPFVHYTAARQSASREGTIAEAQSGRSEAPKGEGEHKQRAHRQTL